MRGAISKTPIFNVRTRLYEQENQLPDTAWAHYAGVLVSATKYAGVQPPALDIDLTDGHDIPAKSLKTGQKRLNVDGPRLTSDMTRQMGETAIHNKLMGLAQYSITD